MWSGVIIESFSHIWNHFWSFPVAMTSFQKNEKKIVISLLLVFEWFFRNKNIMIVKIIEYASKWWVTWPFLHYQLENDHFDHFIGKFIPTSGLMINLSRHDYFWDQCLLGFILRYRKWRQLIIHRKVPKNYRKILFIVLSRDPRYDNQNKIKDETSTIMCRFIWESQFHNNHLHFR